MTTLQARVQETSPKKSFKLNFSNNNHLALSRTQSIQSDDAYNVKFNAELLKALETDYRTTNSHLYTWRHNMSQQDYVRIPTSTSKKGTSQADLKLEDITDNIGISDTNALGSPYSAKYMNMRISVGYNPFETRKQAQAKTASDGFQTPGSGRVSFDDRYDPSVKHKKSYSITKLQRDLLTNEASAAEDVPNYEFMTNQFDRRNYTVNKIISQIAARDDRLDKEEIKEETLRKLKYVSGNIKLQKSLKPKTASNSISRSKIILTPKGPKANDYDFFPGADSRQFQEKDATKRNNNLDPTNKKTKGYRHLLDIPEPEIYSNAGRSSQISRTEEAYDLKLINKARLGQVIQQMSHRDKKTTEPSKLYNKGFVEGVGIGLREMESRNRDEFQNQKEAKNARFFVRVHSSQDYKRELTPKCVSKEELIKSKASSPQGVKQLSDDNLFNFGVYFKKKYLEKETPFEFSKDLKKRIQSFEKGIKLSARKSQTFGSKIPT